MSSKGLKLPDLEFAPATTAGILGVGVLVVLTPAVYFGRGFDLLPLCIGAAFVGIILGGLAGSLLKPLAASFPNGIITVGDLAREVLALNHAKLVADVGGWNRNNVWETLCRIIVRQTGVRPDRLSPDASILDDLGIC